MWILDEKAEEGPKIIKKEITYIPGLYKIFDEILGENKKFPGRNLLLNLFSSQCC